MRFVWIKMTGFYAPYAKTKHVQKYEMIQFS